MKIYIFYILLFGINVSILGQNDKIFVGNYLVTKIHVTDDYYLIFLKMNDEKYTIHSDKDLKMKNIDGLKIQKDSTYYFELKYVPSKFESMNYGEIITPYGFSGFEIGKLCRAKNLIGLTIIAMDNDKEKKMAKRKKKM